MTLHFEGLRTSLLLCHRLKLKLIRTSYIPFSKVEERFEHNNRTKFHVIKAEVFVVISGTRCLFLRIMARQASDVPLYESDRQVTLLICPSVVLVEHLLLMCGVIAGCNGNAVWVLWGDQCVIEERTASLAERCKLAP